MFDIDVSTFYYMQNKLNACSKWVRLHNTWSTLCSRLTPS
jgi:hypothetical protein